jgi:type I restriction enzyme, S subunit
MNQQWKQYKLREVCTLINGRAYSKPELLAEGKYPVLRVGNFFTNDHWYYSDMELEADKYCDDEDLLYAWSASFGPRIWTGGKVIFHYHIWKVQPNPEFINKNFLFAWFLWDTDRLKHDHGTGTTMIHVAKGSMEEREILVPPILEQRRIVGILEDALEGISAAKANAEKNLQNARVLFESHLQSVFIQRGKGWAEKELGDFCSFENGDRGTNYPSKSARTATGIPFINAGHLTEDGIDLETMDYIPRERFDLLSNGKIRKGDILFCLRGSLGKFASVGDLSEGAIASSLVIVRPDKTVLNEYLVFYFRSPICSEMINHFKNGAAQPNLSAQSLREFIAPIPPLPQQRLIVEKLTDLRAETQRLESIYEQKLAALEALKKSLLHQAFTGKL